MEGKQEVQERNHDRHAKQKKFDSDARVWVRDYRRCKNWSPGVIAKQSGPVSYEVNVRGQLWNQHAEQSQPG